MNFLNSLNTSPESEQVGFEPPQGAHCRACGKNNLKAYVTASVNGIHTPTSDCEYIYFKCGDCGSLNEYSETGTFYEKEVDQSFANYYTDVLAGLDDMLYPIGVFAEAIGPTKDLEFLELGCGFGFSVDFAAKCCNFLASGIEPGGYGLLGAKALGVNVTSKLLGEGSVHDHKTFDLIYSSEVIEHIAAPGSFVATIAIHLNTSGAAIFTTPNANFIANENSNSDVYSCLFPGEHKIIFSPEGLEAILKNSGFSEVCIIARRNSSLIAFASIGQLPFDPDKIPKNKSASDYSRIYLSKVVSTYIAAKQRIPRIGLGLSYRLFKDYVNTSNWEQADKLLSAILPSLRSEVDTDFDTATFKADGGTENYRDTLELCRICLVKEMYMSQILRLPYPRGGIAFAKHLGYYLSICYHNKPGAACAAEMTLATSYLEIFIDHALWLRQSSHPDYHIELLSLIGPATASLLLFKLKLASQINDVYFSLVQETWFQNEHPSSYLDCVRYLEIFTKQKNSNATAVHDASSESASQINKLLSEAVIAEARNHKLALELDNYFVAIDALTRKLDWYRRQVAIVKQLFQSSNLAIRKSLLLKTRLFDLHP